MDAQITNESANSQIKAISITKKVKGLRVPVKLTNNYHKKLKAL
jgi:K+-transporting ATPase c subunit